MLGIAMQHMCFIIFEHGFEEKTALLVGEGFPNITLNKQRPLLLFWCSWPALKKQFSISISSGFHFAITSWSRFSVIFSLALPEKSEWHFYFTLCFSEIVKDIHSSLFTSWLSKTHSRWTLQRIEENCKLAENLFYGAVIWFEKQMFYGAIIRFIVKRRFLRFQTAVSPTRVSNYCNSGKNCRQYKTH